MTNLRSLLPAALVALLLSGQARLAPAGDWPKLLDHPPAGTNTVVLINCDSLRLGAAKLKHFKDGEQKTAAENLLAEIPENSKRAALSASFNFDSLEPAWELATVSFDKSKVPTPKGIAEKEGGYLDPIGGRSVVWSPRGRYIVPHSTDRLSVYKPAERSGLARWIRQLSQPAQPLPDYLKKVVERSLDSSPLVLAVDMADTISPVPIRAKLNTLPSLAKSQTNLDELAKLIADLHGITFSVNLEDQFVGELQFDFGSAPSQFSKLGQGIVVDVFARRGILLPELRTWKSAVQGKSFVLSGPLDAGSVVSLLSFFTSTPSTEDAAYESPTEAAAAPPAASSGNAKAAQASKRYFTAVQRVLSECRDTKGLSVAERGVFNDKLSRKIDNLSILNVDKDLLDYGNDVARLIRGAGLAIRSANVQAGGQKAVAATSATYNNGYGGGGYYFNDNSEYNSSLERQAHAQGMQQHITNMEQVDNATAEIRRRMTEKYMIEF